MNSKISSKCSKSMVAVIDIGTTYSGYAFSFKDRWGQVMTRTWRRSDSRIVTKEPTCLLLKKDNSVCLFGYDAEIKYSELKSEDNHKDYYFFQRFPVILHENVSVERRITCQDIHGDTLEASMVFMHSIKYLKNHLHELVKKTYWVRTDEDDIQYVLTVPGIWGMDARLFMKETAIKAGIKTENLTIVLEAEAASIYCQYLHIANDDTSCEALGVIKPGTKYMLVDLRGERAAVTVHQKCVDNTLEEIVPTNEGPWGGNSVGDQFVKFLKELVGEKVMENNFEQDMDEYFNMMRDFKSRFINSHANMDTAKHVNVKIPYTLLEIIDNLDKQQKYRKDVEFVGDKFRFKIEYFKGFFKKVINSIVKHIDELFQEDVVRDIDIIVMVGGFSECKLVQDAIKRNFEGKTVIVPKDAELAVLKGAVYFGHVPDAIPQQSSRYTYGFQTWPKFKADRHPVEKRVTINGSIRCSDVFFKVITKGDKIMTGLVKSQIIQVQNCGEDYLECGLFISKSKNPRFIDEPSCKMLATLRVPLFGKSEEATCLIKESLMFRESGLVFRARDVHSNAYSEVNFGLLYSP